MSMLEISILERGQILCVPRYGKWEIINGKKQVSKYGNDKELVRILNMG